MTGNSKTITLYAQYSQNQPTKYTVTYKPGTQGNFTDDVHSNVIANSLTPAFAGAKDANGNPTGNLGYIFAGWSPTVSAKVTSDATYIATWTPATNTKYKVEHYKQNLNGSYDLEETDTLTGTTDAYVTATANTYAGFTENTKYTDRVASGNIKGDGTLVLKLYYDRNEYGITYDGNGNDSGIAPTDVNSPYMYGATVTVLGNTGNLTKIGHIFVGWNTKADGTGTSYIPAPVLKAARVASGAGATLAMIKPESSFVIEGNTILYAQYAKEEYEVTYKPGSQGTFADDVHNAEFEDPTPAFAGAKDANGNPAGNLGYIFAGWSPTVSSKVTNDTTYIATWTPATDTKYTVEHYKETSNGTYILADTENLEGTTDQDAIAIPKIYAGYIENATHADRVAKGKIKGDGTLVLKLYYDMETIQVVYDGNGSQSGATPSDGNNPYKSPANITVLGNSGGLAKPGYIFKEWNTKADGTGTSYTEGELLEIDKISGAHIEYLVDDIVTLYAQYEKVPTPSPTPITPSVDPGNKGTAGTITPTAAGKATANKTGDNSDMMPWIMLMGLAMAAAAGTIVTMRRKEN